MTIQNQILAHLPLVLFGARAALLWVLANYIVRLGTRAECCEGSGRSSVRRRRVAFILARSLVLACTVSWLADWSGSLAAFTFALAVLFPLVSCLVPSSYLAEVELAFNFGFLAGAPFLAVLRRIPLTLAAGSEPGVRQEASVCIVIAIVILVMGGGSHIVRGVLDKGQILPISEVPGSGTAGARREKELDTPPFNRGRIVGMIERVMLLAFVAMQAYDALAFLLTAKGLFRSKELDDPAFAEYFLVGTLTSSLIAIAAGLAIQCALKLLW